MEQANGGGLRESNRSKDLVALLNPFISQIDFQPGSSLSSIAANAQQLVVSANIEENIVIPVPQSEVEGPCDRSCQHAEKHCLDPECSCLTEESFKASEEVCAAEEEIAAIGDFNAEIIESRFSTTGSDPTPRSCTEISANNSAFVSHNNICKTIKEIANNQKSFISDMTMPQNSLLEEAITMSNIAPPSVSSSSGFMSMQNGVSLQQPQNRYPLQNWSVDSGNTVPGNCEASNFTNSRPSFVPSNVNPTGLPQYAVSNMDGGYMRNVVPSSGYQGQQQFMDHTDRSVIGNQLGQMLHNSQLPMQEYQTHLGPEASPAASGAQDQSITYDKMNTYNQNTLYNTNPGQLPHSQTSNLQTTMSYPNAYHVNSEEHFSKVALAHDQSKTRNDSGGEDMEDRRGEKKLTTTPIPSDAEKMSSSGSVSSGSIEESPSPGGLDPEQRMNNAGSKLRSSLSGDVSGNYTNYSVHHSGQNQDLQRLLSESTLENQFNTSDILNTDNALTSIPTPENVVEIDESSFDYHNVVIATDVGDNLHETSSLPCTEQVDSLGNATPGQSLPRTSPNVSATTANSGLSKSHSVSEGPSSWSVMKEERRKRKLEKKLKAKQLAAQGLDPEVGGKVDPSSFGSSKKRHHKHKHRSKHHNKEGSLASGKKASQEYVSASMAGMSEKKSYSSGTSYSGLIPKVTADPTNNANLPVSKVPSGPIKSITERVRQQIEEEKLRNSGKHKSFTSLTPVINQIPRSATHSESSQPSLHQKTSSNATKSPAASAIAPAKLAPVNREKEHNSSGLQRWQTVTAVQGPKLPPVLSERDRIPKRGRPSKKMSEINLKYKGDGDTKEGAAKSQPSAPSARAVASTEGSNVVAMYTIGAAGFQELDNKPKQNQRSKERAAAFRSYLSEISRTSSIQNKTAGAKDAVGAFAVGVRTRKQASSSGATDGDRKKKKSKNKRAVFGGDAANLAKPPVKNEANVKCLDDNGMYTFSELAKHFKISNSILYRAMEQSKRISGTKRKTHKPNGARSSFPQTPPKTTSDPTTNQITSTQKTAKSSSHKLIAEDEAVRKERTENNESVSPESIPLKPTSLSSEKSVDLASSDKIKRKKKHKKEKGDSNKKKKRKDKKKKSKQKQKLSKELSDSVFSPECNTEPVSETLTEAKTPTTKLDVTAKLGQIIEASPKLKNRPSTTVVHKESLQLEGKSSTSKADAENVRRSKASRSGSVSSLSGGEEAYDGEDSSSDIGGCSRDVTAEFNKPANKLKSNTISSTSASSSVFGSGISTVMPSFQGIKEHGGLIQFSEHSKGLSEPNVIKTKKHKHKKKKLLGRSKNASDPEFLCKMESTIEALEKLRFSPTMGFLTSPFTGKSLNVFATAFQPKPPGFRSSFEKDAFSYRDPARSHSKQKSRSAFNFSSLSSTSKASTSARPVSSSLHSNMSTFCQSEFFKNHGLIKPFSGPTTTNTLTAPIQALPSNAQEKYTFIKDMPPQPLFAQNSSFSSFLHPNQSTATNVTSSKSSDLSTSAESQKQEEEESSQALKPTKRKRGWPRGKPRGPRSKKPSLDSDASPSFGEKPPAEDRHVTEKQGKSDESKDEENSNKISSSVHRKKSPTTKSNETVAPSKNTGRNSSLASTSDAVRKASSDEDGLPSRSQSTSSPANAAGGSENSTKAVINHELVDHIKAAIAEKLTKSNVCSDTVAKTVDSAVASFFQGLGANEFSKTTLSPQPSNDNPTADQLRIIEPPHKKIKRRGRPPKHPRPVQPSKEQSASEEDQKCSDKHPKKLWASMHQVYSKASENLDGKPKKRGPGRPRKYAIAPKPSSATANPSQPPKTAKSRAMSKTSEFFGCQRASALYTPSTRLIKKHLSSASTLTSQPKSKRGRKPNALTTASRKSKPTKETVAPPGSPRLGESVISNHKAKEAADAALSCKVLQHQAKSTSLARADAQTDAKEADDEANDSVDGSTETVRTHSDSESAETKSLSSSESSLKTCSKKSLESVVAKLKSKQNNTSNDVIGNGNCNENNNIPSTRQSDHGNQTTSAEEASKITSQHKEASAASMPCLSAQRKRSRSSDSVQSHPPAKKANLSCRERTHEPAFIEKNKYLHAGLFSSEFKSDRDSRRENTSEDSNAVVSFPPPKHAGLFLRKNRRDFQLPYHLWWGFNQKQIPAKQDVSTDFIVTDKNIYVDTHSTVETEKHVCACPPDTSSDTVGCGKECLNRLMYTECSPSTCPSGERCGNRSIQHRQWWKDIERFETSDRGWGLRTTSDVPEGQFILEYLGEVVSEVKFRRRVMENYSFHGNRYCAQLEAGKIIDAYRMGNEGRFVNHSCQPNCEMQRWVAEGEYHLCLFAKQSIKAGTELTFNYSSHAFEQDELQPCRCGASSCRGVIGSKTRVYPESSLNRMSKALHGPGAKKKTTAEKKGHGQLQYMAINENSIEPATLEEQAFIRDRRPFLFRNLVRIKQQHERAKLLESKGQTSSQHCTRDRKDTNNEVERKILLYDAIQNIFTKIMTCKDESGVSVALPFINLRSKQHNNKDPVDLSFVEDKIVTKQYENLEEFSLDLLHAFRNAEKYFGRKSSFGKGVARLRRTFTSARNNAAAFLGETTEKNKNKDLNTEVEPEDRRKNGDYIRCICGIYRDEGTMIQCEKCYVWQHCDCMKVKPSDYNDSTEYLCEECDGRDVAREVEVTPQPLSAPPGHTYYLSLLKDNLLVKQGDCVRIIHDHCLRQRTSNNPPVRASYRLQSHSTPDRMDFFRIQKLWTDDNGDKFAYGYHFVRPQDTKHSEGRMFFTNELIATPFHEIVPLEAVVSLCCVMDLETYRKGKPKDFKPPDVYICQHRVDLSLRIVNKVVKNRFPVCTKAHVFHSYPVKIVTVRDYQVPEQYRKTQSRRTQWLKSIDRGTKSSDEEESSDNDNDDYEASQSPVDDVTMETVAMESDDQVIFGNERNVKQRRLNGILTKLLKDANRKKKD